MKNVNKLGIAMNHANVHIIDFAGGVIETYTNSLKIYRRRKGGKFKQKPYAQYGSTARSDLFQRIR